MIPDSLIRSHWAARNREERIDETVLLIFKSTLSHMHVCIYMRTDDEAFIVAHHLRILASDTQQDYSKAPTPQSSPLAKLFGHFIRFARGS